MIELCFREAGFCYIYSLPSLRGRHNEQPGFPDVYGRSDEDKAYYMLLADGENGMNYKIPRGVEASMVYPDRVFAWGVEDGQSVDPARVMELLNRTGLRPCWDRVNLHRGYSKGVPTFHRAWKAHTDYGVRWYEVQELKIKGRLPEGWQMDFSTGIRDAILYVDEQP